MKFISDLACVYVVRLPAFICFVRDLFPFFSPSARKLRSVWARAGKEDEDLWWCNSAMPAKMRLQAYQAAKYLYTFGDCSAMSRVELEHDLNWNEIWAKDSWMGVVYDSPSWAGNRISRFLLHVSLHWCGVFHNLLQSGFTAGQQLHARGYCFLIAWNFL